ncbi:DUF4174 domain-containing protein [Psychroflexus salis]|uniref:DUF4174 domain-containing protein n=1 Tax=Psychroflexus salis TaxID=1526574 RepID=A0A917EAG6_9FLAO|nr:DUF4174 domain-containing protein [Psychroflexus salis]GGE16347.1 hypothetical protein GCM10010831_17050 [Psychroflexus salis]
MNKVFCILFLCIIGSLNINAQATKDKERRWLVLLSPEDEHPQLQKQIDAIQANQDAAIERKIGVIQITNQETKAIFNSPIKNFNLADSFQNLQTKDSDFELVLIGLDNNTKLKRTKAIDADDLFKLIDRMPMRKAEIQQKKRKERLEEKRKNEHQKSK